MYALIGFSAETAPYPAAFPFFGPGENAALQHYRQLVATRAWPQPTLYVSLPPGDEPGRVLGRDDPAANVRVELQRVGSAQLWWGGDLGLLWEAFLDARNDALLPRLRDGCERHLALSGARRCVTTHRDPAFAPDAYAAHLEARGYALRVRRSPDGRDIPYAEKTLAPDV